MPVPNTRDSAQYPPTRAGTIQSAHAHAPRGPGPFAQTFLSTLTSDASYQLHPAWQLTGCATAVASDWIVGAGATAAAAAAGAAAPVTAAPKCPFVASCGRGNYKGGSRRHVAWRGPRASVWIVGAGATVAAAAAAAAAPVSAAPKCPFVASCGRDTYQGGSRQNVAWRGPRLNIPLNLTFIQVTESPRKGILRT